MDSAFNDMMDEMIRNVYMSEAEARSALYGEHIIRSEYFNENTIVGEVVEDERDTEPDIGFRIDDATHTHIRNRIRGHWGFDYNGLFEPYSIRRRDAYSDFLGRPYARTPVSYNFGPRPIDIQEIREALSRIGAYSQGRRLPQGSGDS